MPDTHDLGLDLDLTTIGEDHAHDAGRLFNAELYVDVGTPHRRAAYLVYAFLWTYSNLDTQRGYKQALLEWLQFLHDIAGDVNPVSDDVRRVHVDAYSRWLEDRGLQPATVARKQSAVAMWYRYLLGERYVTFDPTVNVRRPNVSQESTREFLMPRELEDFVHAAENEGGYPAALACLLALNALRVGEATRADVTDLGKEQWHHTLHIIGKGAKHDLIAIPGRGMHAIDRALDGRTEGPLLLNRAGTRMDRESAGRIVKRLARRVAPGKHITPHSIRHSALTADLMSGADITQTQELARHADVRTTQRYDRRVKKLAASGSYRVANYLAHYS